MKNLLLITIAAVLLVGTASAGPIHDAVNRGDLAAVQSELDKGANVNAKMWRRTPLHWAASRGQKEIAELVIAKGSEVNAKNVDGDTPLDRAITSKQAEIANLLRKHGGKTGEELKVEGAK